MRYMLAQEVPRTPAPAAVLARRRYLDGYPVPDTECYRMLAVLTHPHPPALNEEPCTKIESPTHP